jgi:succinate dehydrogenase / fumarate reductase membrane anchor subunit
MSFKTPLSRVRGLGSAKAGVGHFWAQRVTAAALVPLTVWFLASVVAYVGADYDATITYLKHPFVAVLLLLFIGATLWHTQLGLQVIVEDYIHRESTKIALIVLVTFFAIGLFAIAAMSILEIALAR